LHCSWPSEHKKVVAVVNGVLVPVDRWHFKILPAD
jgi:sulfur carrier protein ThiS